MFQVQKMETLTGHLDSVYALVQGDRPEEVFSAGTDGFVAKWSLEDTEKGELIVRMPSSVYTLCFVKEKKHLAIGQNYKGVHLIDLKDNKEIASTAITQSAIFAMVCFKELLLVGCGDGRLSILNVNDLSTVKHLQLSDKSIRCFALYPEANHLAIGYSDNCIRILDLATLQVQYEINAHTNSVFSLTYSPDYQYLLSGSRDAHLKIWRVKDAYALHIDIVAHLFTINDICYSPDRLFFATCSKDKSIKLWRAEDFKLLKVIDRARHAGHGTSVNRLLWSSHHDRLLSCSDDKTISVWELFYS
jgi:WD40 repeat protein